MSNDHSLSRRRFIVTGLAAGAGLLARNPVGSQDPPSSLADATADQLLDQILDATDPSLATDAVVEVFARAGIAVFDDNGTQAIVPPTAPVSPLTFQRWQLHSLVTEFVAGGRPASELDSIFPTETPDGTLVPTVGELIAGYYGGVETAGADFTRAWLDRTISDGTRVTAGEIPAPTLIVSLMSGEILGDMARELGLSTSANTTAQPHPGQPAVMAFRQAPGLQLPGLPEIPAIPDVGLPQVPVVTPGTVCSAAQGFITTVQQRIFSILNEASKLSKIPILGKIIDVIIDGVRIGLGVITKAVETVLAPVMNVLKSIGAGLAIASLIVGTLSPWTVALDLRPTQNRFGIDAEVVTGEIGVTASGWDRIDYPPILRDCAAVAGIALPEPTSKGAPAILAVSQGFPLITIGNPNLVLDAQAMATATYVTGNESAKQATGNEMIGIAWITATIEREDLRRLRDQLLNLLFAQLPSLVSSIVQPLVGPVATQMSDRLIALAKVSGTRPLYVSYHEPPEEPDVPVVTEESESDCLPGRFQVADPAIALRSVAPELGSIEVTSGALTMDFQPGGAYSSDYNGLVLSLAAAPGVAFTFTFSGGETGTWSTEGGVLTVTVTGSTVALDGDFAGVPIGVSGSEGGAVSGPYTCGNPVVWEVTVPELGVIPYSLIPIG